MSVESYYEYLIPTVIAIGVLIWWAAICWRKDAGEQTKEKE